MKLRFLAVLALFLPNVAGASSSEHKDSSLKKELIQVASANANHAVYTYNDFDKGAYIACILDGPNEQVNKDIFNHIHDKFFKLTSNAETNANLIINTYKEGCLKALKGKKAFNEETCRESRIEQYNSKDLPRYIAWLSCVYTSDKTECIAQVYNSCPKQFPEIEAYKNVNLSNKVKINKSTLAFSFMGTEVTAPIATFQKEYATEKQQRQHIAPLNQNRSRCDCNIL